MLHRLLTIGLALLLLVHSAFGQIQTMDQRIRMQIGELVVANTAQQVQIEQLTEQNNRLAAKIKELEEKLAGGKDAK